MDLRGRYVIRSNRESGYGRYVLEPCDPSKDNAFIFEFKVLDASDRENSLQGTVASALAQPLHRRHSGEHAAQAKVPPVIEYRPASVYSGPLGELTGIQAGREIAKANYELRSQEFKLRSQEKKQGFMRCQTVSIYNDNLLI